MFTPPPKIIFFFLLLCLGWVHLQAQEVVARLDLDKRTPTPDFINYSPEDGGLVTLGPANTRSTRNIALHKYGPDFKPEWSKNVLEQNGRKNLDFMTVIGANILVFVSEFIPKESVIKTYYYRFDLEGNLIDDEAVLSVYPNQKEQKVELQYVLSANKKKLLCYKNLENRRESEQILYYVFDENGEYTRSGEVKVRYPDDKFNIRSVQVSNQGNVYVLGKFYRTTRIRDVNDFKYLMYRFDTSVEEGVEIPFDLGDRFITDLAFKVDRFENIFVAGFYSHQGTDQIIGTVFQKITPGGELEINANQEFNEEFLSNYLSTGQIDRGKELRNFILNDIVLRSDGGVLLMAEKFYITYQSYRDIYGYWVDREIFHFEDVILTSIDNTGAIEWHAIIDKNQESEDPVSLSYFDAIGAQGALIFYEYKPRKMDPNIYYNVVQIDGQVSGRMALLKGYRFGNVFYPRFCEQISNREALMVYFQNQGKILSIVKLDIEGGG